MHQTIYLPAVLWLAILWLSTILRLSTILWLRRSAVALRSLVYRRYAEQSISEEESGTMGMRRQKGQASDERPGAHLSTACKSLVAERGAQTHTSRKCGVPACRDSEHPQTVVRRSAPLSPSDSPVERISRLRVARLAGIRTPETLQQRCTHLPLLLLRLPPVPCVLRWRLLHWHGSSAALFAKRHRDRSASREAGVPCPNTSR
jgi:hypothetical protein